MVMGCHGRSIFINQLIVGASCHQFLMKLGMLCWCGNPIIANTYGYIPAEELIWFLSTGCPPATTLLWHHAGAASHQPGFHHNLFGSHTSMITSCRSPAWIITKHSPSTTVIIQVNHLSQNDAIAVLKTGLQGGLWQHRSAFLVIMPTNWPKRDTNTNLKWPWGWSGIRCPEPHLHVADG